MFGITTRNVQQALPNALNVLQVNHIRRESRNGPVMVLPAPAIIEYQQPCERVIFWPIRDANPFFHFMECLWMIKGRDDVAFVANYVKTMKDFSDDGVRFNAAYGYRWRKHFGKDQLYPIALALKNNPDCRRQVLTMWDGHHDLGLNSKDLPCNTQAYFLRGANGELNLTVLNRSNDLVWGSLGANAVHFSFLLEYMAMLIGCPVGKYWQISNNLHGYLKTTEPLLPLGNMAIVEWANSDPYAQGQVKPYPIIQPGEKLEDWEQDLNIFFEMGIQMLGGYKTRFFKKVVVPLAMAHNRYKGMDGSEKFDKAIEALTLCEASDWAKACEEWILRRQAKWEAAADSGAKHE